MVRTRVIYGWAIIIGMILLGLSILSCWPPRGARAEVSSRPEPKRQDPDQEAEQPVLWQVLIAFINSHDVRLDPAPSLERLHRQCMDIGGVPRVRLVMVATQVGPLVFHHVACFPPRVD